jgi:hypothetical protein
MLQPTRSGRVPKPKLIWEAPVGPILPNDTKNLGKKRVETLEVAPASTPAPPAVRDAIEAPPTNFSPLICVENQSFQVRWIEREPLDLFLRFFSGLESLNLVCEATNNRAKT